MAEKLKMSCLIWFLISAVEMKADDIVTSVNNNIISHEIVFKRFLSRNGLPDDRIRSIYQDSIGFLWIGTMNGLCKYDGYTFKKYYKTSKRNSISGNWSFTICEDSLHHIWIGTLDGLNCFDTQKEIFTGYKHDPDDPHSLLCDEIYTLLFDRYGKLWIGTSKGLTRFDTGSKQFTRFDRYPFNLAIAKIIQSYDNYLWILTSDGVVHLNVETGEHRFYDIPVKANPFGEKFWSLLEHNRNLYIATGGEGLFRLRWNQQTMDYDPPLEMNRFAGTAENLENVQIFDICRSDKGDIWLGTEKGLAKIENIESPAPLLIFYRNSPINDRSISNDMVYQVFIDRANVLWCGTELGLNMSDLHLLPFRYFTFTDQHYKDQVRNIFSQNGRDIWVGTARKGFFKYDIQTGNTRYHQFNTDFNILNSTRAILEENQNRLWLGTLGGAISINRSHEFTKEIDGATYACLKDSKNNIWIGTNKGLHRISPNGGKRLYLHQNEDQYTNRSEFLRALYEDHQGNIWCGFENSGVFYLNPETGDFVKIHEDPGKNKIMGSMIFSILEYPRNVVWIGSESGLNKITFDDNRNFTIKNYSEKDGLTDISISGIQTDNNGNLWISTICGLMRFNISGETFEYFLTDFSFSKSCVCLSDPHSLFMGTDDGFILFDPSGITGNEYQPKVVITDFKLFNESTPIGEPVNKDVILDESISRTKSVKLNYKNNVFSLIFSALHFADPPNNKFAYKLNGFDADWIQTDVNHTASYTNLNPGTYVFMVKTVNNSGVWSNNPAELKIIVLPPPWKTWWAYIGYALIIFSILYAMARYYIQQIKHRHQIEIEKREKEQLMNLNQAKLKFFTDVAHEFRTPLMLITAPIDELGAIGNLPDTARKKIDMANRNCKKLNYLVDELMTFRKIDQNKLSISVIKIEIVNYIRELFLNFQPVALQKNISFSFTPEIEKCTIYADPKSLEKIFNNLLSNAFKFTSENDAIHIKIYLTEMATDVCIEIEDTGKGIASENIDKVFERFYQVDLNMAGTGIGLSLVKNLVELHQGRITVESELNRFTRFKVYFNREVSIELEMTDFYLNPDLPSLLVDCHPEPSNNNLLQNKDHSLLLVDDNPEVLEFLESIFEDKYQLQLAGNGLEAVHRVIIQEPDLIISDMMMPEMDGVEFCRRIKSDVATCHIPFILLTAKSSVENEIEGMEEGADAYITKPFHPSILKARVKNLIESRRKMIEKFNAGNIDSMRHITKNKIDRAFIQKILNHVTVNMTLDEFDVEELSAIVGMSRSNLYRKLKAITGQTPVEFIFSIRMKRSLELLIEQKHNISEIADQVGFENISSFSRAFRKHYGMPPSEYLKSRT